MGMHYTSATRLCVKFHIKTSCALSKRAGRMHDDQTLGVYTRVAGDEKSAVAGNKVSRSYRPGNWRYCTALDMEVSLPRAHARVWCIIQI
ncbi:hypothetical protein AG1IA_00646 [Rhizoctonia solani AG-1 IA]|uniref:Uncharacterized protein n=1 Tax=Thanatephorus cucumeris (strain AG1-IA) TaxID=983506 RepID=L8X8D9_THACA|nr:hypothetical protein AG1IA_00646 [Rhizoctonia solani AG-1 IA]